MQKLNYLTGAIADNRDGQLINQMLKGVYNRLSTQLFNTGGLVAGTTATKVKTANAITYTVNGVLCLKAATDDLFVMPTVSIAHDAPNVICFYLDAAGAASTAAGGAGTVVSGNGTDPKGIKFPPTPENKCLVGFVIISTAVAAWVGGTNDVATAGDYTTTFVNAVGFTFDQTATI
jgi:hypothetical protein